MQAPRDYAKYLRTLEPNIGNIAFSTRVVAVEGPLDLLAYRTVLERGFRLDLNNVGIVAAWGKDTLVEVVKMCQALGVPVFVIHDWDLDDGDLTAEEAPGPTNQVYAALTPEDKAQYTKNHTLLNVAGAALLHANKRNLESVLGISKAEKSAVSVFERVKDLDPDTAAVRLPGFMPRELLAFVSGEP
jgi:hypothetical protein